MSIRSPYPPVEIPDVSVFDYVFGDSGPDLDRVAIVDGPSGASITYRELIEQIEAVAGALSVRGIGLGDVVALHAPNGVGFAIAFHAIMRAGATVTTVPVLATGKDVTVQISDAAACAMFTTAAALAGDVSAAGEAGIAHDAVFVIDDGVASHDKHETLESLAAQRQPPPTVNFDPSAHLAVLPYSSGTTGRPKGVKLTHRNLVANLAQIEPRMGVGRNDVVVAVLPFFHIYGMTVVLNQGLSVGAKLVTMPKFALDDFLGLIARERVTYAFIAPPLAVALAKHPLVDDYDTSSLRTMLSGAAPLDANLARTVADRLGVRVRQGYGMSEMSPVSHFIPAIDDDAPLDSVGTAVPNTENKLVNVANRAEIEIPDSGISSPGELWVKGPNVMVGYLNNDDATRQILDADGFLHTGDVATVDARGNFTIVDRIKELIKYKGYQVAPAELEALLLTHPQIADAAVIGVRREDGEEVPKAFVVRRPDSVVTEDEVIGFVAEHVAPYKKVRSVEFIDTVPKSAAGKILRRELRSRNS